MSDVADPRRAAIELAAKNEAAWRALSPLSPWAAFYAVDNILKARRASKPWADRLAAAGPAGDVARWDMMAMEAALLILHDVALATEASPTA